MAIRFSGSYFRRSGGSVGERSELGFERNRAGVSPTRRASEGGNTMVEAALVFIPMMIFLLGIVDVSLSVYIQSTLTTAAREGTRFAITYSASYNGNCSTRKAGCWFISSGARMAIY